jgi:hypothetical protein
MEPEGYVLHLAGRIQAAFSLEEPCGKNGTKKCYHPDIEMSQEYDGRCQETSGILRTCN